MGYTHYFSQERSFTNQEWLNICDMVRQVFDHCASHNIELLSEYDSTNPPELTDKHIRFNGKEDEGHETFYINKKHDLDFNFCKTARKPYDRAVCLVLLICDSVAKGTLKISSDGDWDDEWQNPCKHFEELFGVNPKCPWGESE